MLFIHETFLVYKLEIFKKCKEVKHIKITIATIYIFLSYVIIHQQLKITFRRSSGLAMTKSTLSFSLNPPWKFKKCKSPLFANTENFSGPPAERVRDTRVHRSVLRNITTDLLYFWDVYDVNLLEKNISRSMSLYNFIILRKKETPTQVFSCGIHETFKNSGGCFWKHVTYYYIIKIT